MAGSTLAIGALAVTAALGVGCAAVGAAAVRSAQVSTTADAAALAAADAASGAASGEPCERADDVARHAGLSVDGCDVDGLIATVEVSASVGALRVHARARAGPPPASGPIAP